MRSKAWFGVVALPYVLALGGGVAFAGGGHDCGAKSEAHAKAEKHDCNMSAEECAQEMQKSLASRGWLGIVLDMGEEDSLAITKVYPGSPAEQAGFQVGDRIVSINGVETSEKNEEKIHGMLKKAKIGDQVAQVFLFGLSDRVVRDENVGPRQGQAADRMIGIDPVAHALRDRGVGAGRAQLRREEFVRIPERV